MRSGAAHRLFAVLRTMVYTNRACRNKRRSPGAASVAILSAVIVCAAAPQASGSTADATRVRSSDARILALVREGTERSATFSALVDTIGRSNGIVYIEFGYCARGHLNGCLLPYVAPAHGDRYLRITVTPDKNRRSHEQLLALIAHELRHALEAIDHLEVIDVPTLEAMFRRIGTPLTAQSRGYETSAARAAGDAVLAELFVKLPAPVSAVVHRSQPKGGRMTPPLDER